MKVTSSETLKALRQARAQYGSWAGVLEHASRDEDGVLRVPRVEKDDSQDRPGARKAG